MERILVFIPSYNCEAQVGRVLAQVDASITPHIHGVLVLDNMSQDNSFEVAKAAAADLPSATVLCNPRNLGYGGSMKAAIAYALANSYDHILVLHGDDQANIHDFEPLLAAKSYAQADLTMGARFHPLSRLAGYSRLRLYGNQVLNLLCSMLARRVIYDLGSGLNIYRVAAIAQLPYEDFPDDLTFDPCLLCAALGHGWRVDYAPISWREEGQQSNARIFRQGVKILTMFIRHRFHA